MLKCLSKKKRLEVSWIRMCCFVFIFIHFYAYFDFFLFFLDQDVEGLEHQGIGMGNGSS